MRSGSATFSSAVRCGKRLKLWKTNPFVRRCARAASSLQSSTVPATRTSPWSGVSSDPSTRSSVDLPLPDAPEQHETPDFRGNREGSTVQRGVGAVAFAQVFRFKLHGLHVSYLNRASSRRAHADSGRVRAR